ncbi:putative Major facilitator superfamily domain-containing protein [Seiridium cardinale]|uniref:Major facilitator superfamily domain-containing protein n=1 Tax=Seiridium cardinale TaxID=138064 RepID=A0ABR2X9I7_9PEZI
MSTEPAQRKVSESNAPEHDYIETSGPGISPNERATEEKKIDKPDHKKELKEADEYANLGYSYPTWKKWGILTVMFLIQISINLNASLYASGVDNISEKFEISKQAARVPQLTFLVAYAFGCELWAPWSEELGRWPTQQLSLLLVNIWQIPCALAPNYGTLVVCRLLGGLSTAGGSVTLGVLADMWEPDDQEYAIAFLVLSSVGGSVVGAVVGGFVETLQPLPWIFWTQLIAGGAVQIMHFVLVPETRSTIILDRLAKKRRKAGEEVYGPNEVKTQRMTFKEVMVVWSRPFYMLLTEPIVAWLSAVSGFSDNLIFIFLQGFQPVYKQWGFDTIGISLAFLPLLVGYFLAYLSFLPSIHMFRQRRRKNGSESVSPEARLWWLKYVILLEPIGLIGFAWTSLGPSYGVHWIGPMFFSMLVGIANYSIYQSSIDYTVAAYGVYAASATGGNDFARDFLSGIAAIYSGPMYENIGERPLEYASTILAIIALFVTAPVFYFYKHGPEIRMRSKFASEIAKAREQGRGERPKNEGEKAALPGQEQA